MNDKIFFDTNTLIYVYSVDEQDKQQCVIERIQATKNRWISTQVLSEMSNVLRKKFKLECRAIINAVVEIQDNFQIAIVQPSTITQALIIMENYHYSYYDSLIIATALENNCEMLYSEDMQHQQIIEQRTVIINPFK